MSRVDRDSQLANLAAEYFTRAIRLDPDVSVAEIEEAFANHIDQAALSSMRLQEYWAVMERKQPLSYEGVNYDPDKKLVEVGGERAKLSARPLEMLTYMLYRKEQAVGYPELMRLIGADEPTKGLYQIRTLAMRVRNGISDAKDSNGIWNWIQTIPEVGFCLMSRDRVCELARKDKLPFSIRN